MRSFLFSSNKENDQTVTIQSSKQQHTKALGHERDNPKVYQSETREDIIMQESPVRVPFSSHNRRNRRLLNNPNDDTQSSGVRQLGKTGGKSNISKTKLCDQQQPSKPQQSTSVITGTTALTTTFVEDPSDNRIVKTSNNNNDDESIAPEIRPVSYANLEEIFRPSLFGYETSRPMETANEDNMIDDERTSMWTLKRANPIGHYYDDESSSDTEEGCTKSNEEIDNEKTSMSCSPPKRQRNETTLHWEECVLSSSESTGFVIASHSTSYNGILHFR